MGTGRVKQRVGKRGGGRGAAVVGVRRREVGVVRGGGWGFGEMWRVANGRAHEQANRRLGRRGEKLVKAAIATAGGESLEEPVSIWVQGLRMWVGFLLLAPMLVTGWTFLSALADVTLRRQFWTTAAFWYFATGVLLMSGWFWTGLLRPGFLYLYVLGHELTHIAFIKLFRGRVSEWGVSVTGGYVTTNKTNILIALAPYFFPFWSVMILAGYALVGMALPLPGCAEKILYWLTGSSWAFHLWWTAWMIPRDQPDLRENGTFLSLVVIVLANLLVLALLLCVASDHLSVREFGEAWVERAKQGLRWLAGMARSIELPAA